MHGESRCTQRMETNIESLAMQEHRKSPPRSGQGLISSSLCFLQQLTKCSWKAPSAKNKGNRLPLSVSSTWYSMADQSKSFRRLRRFVMCCLCLPGNAPAFAFSHFLNWKTWGWSTLYPIYKFSTLPLQLYLSLSFLIQGVGVATDTSGHTAGHPSLICSLR